MGPNWFTQHFNTLWPQGIIERARLVPLASYTLAFDGALFGDTTTATSPPNRS
jgi:hypothetical protein